MEQSEGYKVFRIYKLNESECEGVKVIFDEETSHLYEFAIKNPQYFAQDPIAVKNEEYPHGLIAATAFSEDGEKKIRARENFNTTKSPLEAIYLRRREIIVLFSVLVLLFVSFYFMFN